MFEPQNDRAQRTDKFATDDGWMEDLDAAEDRDVMPDNEAYENAETFGEVLRQYADTVTFVNVLYPDQMDVGEAKEAFEDGLAGEDSEGGTERG
ncbi:hypothetical protein PV433_26915 [Paenibacillus sp. GYB004]|uniref:hypothetical protein n=1 Tax=Paenibacillus sp. GYB004 TaxID=2994393 RepID=UPI002F96D8DC